MGFKGKSARGLKLSRVKKVTYANKKRTIYSPRPSPLTKKFKQSTPKKMSSQKRKALVLTPATPKRSLKRLNFNVNDLSTR